MIEITLWALGIATYLGIGTVIAGATGGGEDELPLIVFWPILVVIFAVALLFTALHDFVKEKKRKNIRFPRRKTAEQKVLEYSEAPTKVLSQIIAAKIMKEPENLLLQRPGGDWQWVWKSSDKKVSVETNRRYRFESAISVKTVTVNEKPVTVNGDVILKALRKADEFNKAKAEAADKAAANLAALEAVESLLSIPITTSEKGN